MFLLCPTGNHWSVFCYCRFDLSFQTFVYMESYSKYYFLSGVFWLIYCVWDSPMYLHASKIISFYCWALSHCLDITCLSFHLPMDISVLSNCHIVMEMQKDTTMLENNLALSYVKQKFIIYQNSLKCFPQLDYRFISDIGSYLFFLRALV